MARRILTDRLVASLTSNGKSQFEHFDGFCGVLVLRVSASGSKTWDFTFKSPKDGKRARLKIGPYPAISLAGARERATIAQAKVSYGKDPRDVEVVPGDRTMAALIEDRLSMALRGKRRSAARTEWRFAKYVTPFVGTVAVKDFRIEPHYNAIIDPLLKRNRVRTAGMLFQDLRALFNFAISRGLIEYSRIAQVKRPDKPTNRTRVLSEKEIPAIWNCLDAVLTRSDHTPDILRLCLLTGQRLSEVAGMRRDEIDLNERLWTIPGRRTKNAHEHFVPLSEPALSIVREAMKNTNGAYLFPNKMKDGPTTHRVIDFALRKAQLPRVGMPLGKFGVYHWSHTI